jgi:hypothetical protein
MQIALLTMSIGVLGYTLLQFIKERAEEYYGCNHILNGKKIKTILKYDGVLKSGESFNKLSNKISKHYDKVIKSKGLFRFDITVFCKDKNYIDWYVLDKATKEMVMEAINCKDLNLLLLHNGQSLEQYKAVYEKQYNEAIEKNICPSCNCINKPFDMGELQKLDLLYAFDERGLRIDYTN